MNSSGEPPPPPVEADRRPDGNPSVAPSEPASLDALPTPDPLETAQAECTKLRDQLLRTAADFDNFRKRTRRDLEDAHRKGSEELLRGLLPVFDNLERAAGHAEQGADVAAIADGLRMVLKQFSDSIERVGIKRIAGVGQAFDPSIHEAIQQVETTEAAAGTIIAEIAPGYRFGDRLVRAAMVVVAKPPMKSTVPEA